MEETGEAPKCGERPGAPGAAPSPGRSGEGSRSVMEHLIQQQRRRDAQQPREDGEPAGSRPAP